MRVFQNVFAYASYTRHLAARIPAAQRDQFAGWINAFTGDRYCAVHYLDPGPQGDVFLTCNANEAMQRAWAQARGMPARTPTADIVLAQIEDHRSEVFYTQDPGNYGPEFLARLPGCVRRKVCWQSPPANPGDLRSFDVVVNNFPTSLALYGQQGVRTAYFTPSFDPAMAPFGQNADRPIDVVFVGGYSQYHRKRAAVLEEVAALPGELKMVFALDRSRMTRLAESPLGRLLPLSRHRRPASIQAVTVEPVFGQDMYRLFSQSKIVLNGAVDSAGADRGNMRCFEALGCGALLLTDAGNYPDGMVDGDTMVVYRNGDEVQSKVRSLLSDPSTSRRIATQGFEMIRSRYAKSEQWRRFVEIVSQP